MSHRWQRVGGFGLATALSALLTVWGCDTFFGGSVSGDGSGGASTDGSFTTGSATNTSAGGGVGENLFVEVDGDVLEIRPEPVAVDEEGEETASNFRAIQVDPVFEDTAGPKFVKPFDIDNDGMVDLISGWNESQPVQIHLQRRAPDGRIRFETATLGGTGPIAIIAGVDMADFDRDGWLDAAVLVKANGGAGICPTPDAEEPFAVVDFEGEVQILFSPGNAQDVTDGDAWQEVRFSNSQLPGRQDVDEAEATTFPEFNGYTGLTVGDFDGINGPDIVVAFNPSVCEFYGDDPPVNRIELYANPGAVSVRSAGTDPLSVTAIAGGDQAVPVPDPLELNPMGTVVLLDGSGSFSSVFAGVSFFWEQVSGTPVDLAGATSANPTFTAPITPAELSFRLTVSLGGATDFDYVNVVVGNPGNLPPVVSASADQVVIPNTDDPEDLPVTLEAFAFDPDGDGLAISWEQTSGIPVALSGATTSTLTFFPPVEGTELRFRVTVNDGSFFATDEVVITSGVWAPVSIDRNLPTAGDVTVRDVDLDGDLDVVYTFPDSITSNISWGRNPLVPHRPDGEGGPNAVHQGIFTWQRRPVGQVETFADRVTIGDIDLDGFDDVLMRSRNGRVVQWFRHPGAADRQPIFPPPDVVPDRFNFPWQVYTMAEFDFRIPAGIGIGDLTNDGFNEVIVAAGGVVYWYDASVVESVYALWGQNFVVDDTKEEGTTDDPNDPDFIDAGTVINNVTVVDIDGDGFGDVIATFDRRTFSGLNDDTLLWFRNTLGAQGNE